MWAQSPAAMASSLSSDQASELGEDGKKLSSTSSSMMTPPTRDYDSRRKDRKVVTCVDAEKQGLSEQLFDTIIFKY